jgi:hypothetical protein
VVYGCLNNRAFIHVVVGNAYAHNLVRHLLWQPIPEVGLKALWVSGAQRQVLYDHTEILHREVRVVVASGDVLDVPCEAQGEGEGCKKDGGKDPTVLLLQAMLGRDEMQALLLGLHTHFLLGLRIAISSLRPTAGIGHAGAIPFRLDLRPPEDPSLLPHRQERAVCGNTPEL